MSLKRRLRQAKKKEAAELSATVHRVLAVLVQVQRKLPHPLVGIAIGTLIAFTGRSDLVLRSLGMTAIFLWLSVDFWVWLLPKPDKYKLKYAFGWTATYAMLFVVVGIMWWWLDGKLQEQREDVFQNLSASVKIPASLNVFKSVVTVTNNGKKIIGKHRLFCNINSLVVEGDEGMRGVSPTVIVPLRSSAETIAPGGDAESDMCLNSIDPGGKSFVCGDIVVAMLYSLETQPQITEDKQFRFVIFKGQTEWTKDPINSQGWCPATRPS